MRSTPVSSIASSRFLRLQDLGDLDFARGKLSYRGRRRRRLSRILTFRLHSPLLMLLSLVAESIISYFGRTFRTPHHLGGYIELLDFPGGSEVKASAWNARELGSIPGSGRSSGEGNGNPLQYSCLENPMDRGAWWATIHGVTKESDTTE